MKIKKKLFIIIIIFAILQCFGVFFTNSVHAGGSIFDNVFKTGSDYSKMGSNTANDIENYAKPVFETANAAYDILKVIGATIFIATFALTIIGLNLGSIQDKAKIKITLGISFGLALIFINLEKIMETLTTLGEAIENLF